jgi:hypothetical protein
MTTSDTPKLPAERRRARRHKVARRLYEQLVAQNSHRLITLRDGAGEVVAKQLSVEQQYVRKVLTRDPRPEQGETEIRGIR